MYVSFDIALDFILLKVNNSSRGIVWKLINWFENFN